MTTYLITIDDETVFESDDTTAISRWLTDRHCRWKEKVGPEGDLFVDKDGTTYCVTDNGDK